MKAYLGILVEFVGGDVVDWEDELDIVLLCLFNEILDLLGSLRVEEGSSDLQSAPLLILLHSLLTSTFSKVFLKVKDIPPQMIKVLTYNQLSP